VTAHQIDFLSDGKNGIRDSFAALHSFLLLSTNSIESNRYQPYNNTRRHPPIPTQSTHASQINTTTPTITTMSATAAVVPSTCCGREGTHLLTPSHHFLYSQPESHITNEEC